MTNLQHQEAKTGGKDTKQKRWVTRQTEQTNPGKDEVEELTKDIHKKLGNRKTAGTLAV